MSEPPNARCQSSSEAPRIAGFVDANLLNYSDRESIQPHKVFAKSLKMSCMPLFQGLKILKNTENTKTQKATSDFGYSRKKIKFVD